MQYLYEKFEKNLSKNIKIKYIKAFLTNKTDI